MVEKFVGSLLSGSRVISGRFSKIKVFGFCFLGFIVFTYFLFSGVVGL